MIHKGPRRWGPYFRSTNALTDDAIYEYRIKFYAQFNEGSNDKPVDALVTFKYGDIVQRVINYAKNNNENNEQVEIYFSIYKWTKQIYMGVIPDEVKTYGTVTDDYKTDKIPGYRYFVKLFITAAENGVKCNLQVNEENSPDCKAIHKYLFDSKNWKSEALYAACKNNIVFTPISWGEESNDKMHNKFLLASHLQGDGENSVHKNCVYTSSANIDPWGKWKPKTKYYQTGATVYDHPRLFEKYKAYFNLVSHCSTNRTGLQTGMKELARGSSDGLNYCSDADDTISAFFYPMPSEDDSWWNATPALWNPVSFYYNQAQSNSSDDTKQYLKLTNAFVHQGFIDKLNLDSPKYVNVKVHWYKTDGGKKEPGPWGSYVSAQEQATIHAKNYQLAFTDNQQERQHVSMLGSTNAKRNAFDEQANNMIVFKDDIEDDTFYTVFRDMYDYSVRK
jgi:hypothetical protein